MVTYVLGVPGSGKTYYAVYKIFQMKDQYSFVYTNIFLKEYSDNIIQFDFDNFYKIISIAYDMYRNKQTDEDINTFLKQNNYYNCVFFIDEAHNFLSKKDDVLIWWLTYHRHLYHDIFLVTQNLDLIDKRYLSIGEVFIKAVQSSLRLAPNTFFYNKYPNYRLSEKFETEKLPKKKDIFDKYTSGDSVRSKNIIFKYSLFFLFFLVLAIVFFIILKQFVLSGSSHSASNDSSSVVTSSSISSSDSNVTDNDSNSNSDVLDSSDNNHYYAFYCPSSYCFINDKKFPLDFIYYLIKTYRLPYFISSSYLYLMDRDKILFNLLSSSGAKSNVRPPRGVGGVEGTPLLAPDAR